MEREFVSYEQAVALKELGFNVECIAYYNVDPYLGRPCFNMVKPFEHEWCVAAPLKQQVFRWFREKYNLSPIIWSAKINQVFYGYDIIHIKKQKLVINNTELGGGDCDYSIYEEAENACIDKLLELAKQS